MRKSQQHFFLQKLLQAGKFYSLILRKNKHFYYETYIKYVFVFFPQQQHHEQQQQENFIMK